MSRICRALLVVFTVLYVVALALMVSSLFGLFGSEPDPLSGVFLVLLGMPWALLIGDAPEPLLPWLTALAPVLNLLLLAALCRWRATARRGA